MARSGLLTATARLVAQGKNVAATTAAGTPTSLALQRFGHFNGAITRNSSPLGNVISAEVTYSNGLDRIETIRSDGRIEGADPGMAALTGRVEVRFADSTLITQAIDGTRCELVFAWSLGATPASPSPPTPSTGATTTGVTKTVNLGTGGASGSTTVVNIGSATAGAGGTTVVNTPTVTFANAVRRCMPLRFPARSSPHLPPSLCFWRF
jgi:hypothetical protein